LELVLEVVDSLVEKKLHENLLKFLVYFLIQVEQFLQPFLI
jgi:hypothetical protein